MKAARSYSSPLRAEQAAMTRDRIVAAAIELLSRGASEEIGMQDVADHAGVAVRTVYRYFATREDLFDGVVTAIGRQMETLSGPPPATPEAAIDSARDAVAAVFELEPLYRALFATQAGRESHQRSAGRRRDEFAAIYATELSELGPAEVKLVGALLHLVSASPSVLFLKDYWELDADEVGRALEWAARVLINALRDPKQRRAL